MANDWRRSKALLTRGAAAWSALSRIRSTFRLRLWPGGDFTAAGERVPALRLRSMGRGLARGSSHRRHGSCPVCRRSRGGVPAPGGRRAVSEGVSEPSGEVRVGSSSGQDEADCVWARSMAKPETARPGKARNVYLPRVYALLRGELERLFSGFAKHGREADAGQTPADQAGVARSDARAGRGHRELAEAGGVGLLPISCRAGKSTAVGAFPLAADSAVAVCITPPEPEVAGDLEGD